MAIGSARPAATVTSSNVPSPLFRSSDEPARRLPAAPEQQDVEVAVVVVVGLRDVQAHRPGRRARPPAERSSNVPSPRLTKSEAPRSASSDVVKTSGRPSPLKSSKTLPPAMFGPRRSSPTRGRDVVEPAHVELRAERLERDQVLRRDLVGILAQRHVGDVQEPADAEVVGPLLEVRGEVPDRLARARRLLVDGLGRDREDAARRPEAGDAVLRLPPPQGRDPAEGPSWRARSGGYPGVPAGGSIARAIQRVGLGEPAVHSGARRRTLRAARSRPRPAPRPSATPRRSSRPFNSAIPRSARPFTAARHPASEPRSATGAVYG